jgi:hypothetical protein
MVNFGLNSAAILGIFLAVAGAGLYFLRSIRPELARDQDIFFAAVGVLCGGILLTQGWRLDPILQFGQFLLTGSTIFFAYEAIRLRGIATEQAKRSTPIVDEDRPVSRTYYKQEAELDDLEPLEERYIRRRLQGAEDPRSGRIERYEAEPRRSKSRGTTERERLGAGERPPKRRSRPTSRPVEEPVDTWDASLESDWEEKPVRTSRTRPPRRENNDIEAAPRPRRRRPPEDRGGYSSNRDRDAETASKEDYVDYQPLNSTERDSPEDESDRPGRFDY